MLYTASSNIVPWKTEREAEGKLGVWGVEGWGWRGQHMCQHHRDTDTSGSWGKRKSILEGPVALQGGLGMGFISPHNLYPKPSPHHHPPKINLKDVYFQPCEGITNIS